VGGIPEMVDSGKTGFLHDSGDPAGLAGSIVRLTTDDKLREQIIDAARVRAFEEFSREKMLANYATIYEEMLRGR
jgi:glycosyltransferase involved in cell wall biosynthesis